jgi:hypothetical protein
MAPFVTRLASLTILGSVTVVLTAAGLEPAARPKPVLRPAALQVRRLDKADLTLTTSAARDGSLQVDGHGGDLQFRKSVRPNGSYTLNLETSHDAVTIAFSEHAITISRGRKSAALTLATASDEDLDNAHRLLADSRAARLLRTAAANVEESDDSPESAALLMADAVVGLLTGDTSAPRRVAQHLTRRARAQIRPAMMQVDCYSTWEHRVLLASYEWEACERDFSVWNPARHLCAARWLIQAESYWFSFLSCSGTSQF